MNTLKIYVETMFYNLPNTKGNFEAKADILASMENRYEALIANGKSIEEATGAVISQFGNFNELKEVFGISSSDMDDKESSKQSLNNKKEYEGLWAITMLSATAIFLLIGFLVSWSYPTWIIFPTTAIGTRIYIEILERRKSDYHVK